LGTGVGVGDGAAIGGVQATAATKYRVQAWG